MGEKVHMPNKIKISQCYTTYQLRRILINISMKVKLYLFLQRIKQVSYEPLSFPLNLNTIKSSSNIHYFIKGENFKFRNGKICLFKIKFRMVKLHSNILCVPYNGVMGFYVEFSSYIDGGWDFRRADGNAAVTIQVREVRPPSGLKLKYLVTWPKVPSYGIGYRIIN